MKKEVSLLLFIAAMAISGCVTQDTDNPEEELQEEIAQTEVQDQPDATVEEESVVMEEENAEPQNESIVENETAEEPVDEEEFQIIQPRLTYENAYNGPLYATSEQIGEGYPIEKYMDNLDRNGVNWFIGFFTYLDEPEENHLVTSSGLGYVISAVQKYPRRIIPYYNPGLGGEEVESLVGDRLTAMYRTNLAATERVAGDGFIRGLGEVETQEWSVAHDSPQVRQLFDLAKANGIDAMFHPVARKISQVEQIAEAYPETTFIIHMYRSDLDESRSELIRILREHDNVYFSIDAAHIAHLNNMDIVYDLEEDTIGRSKSAFISTFDSNYNTMLSEAVSDYRPLVEGAPDKVIWGTEMGPEYSFEPEVYDRMVRISRKLIGQMGQEYQEGLGYRNALEAFGEGTVISGITVTDTTGWPLCTSNQMDSCDGECGIDGEGETELEPEKEACFQACLLETQCIDNPEDDS